MCDIAVCTIPLQHFWGQNDTPLRQCLAVWRGPSTEKFPSLVYLFSPLYMQRLNTVARNAVGHCTKSKVAHLQLQLAQECPVLKSSEFYLSHLAYNEAVREVQCIRRRIIPIPCSGHRLSADNLSRQSRSITESRCRSGTTTTS